MKAIGIIPARYGSTRFPGKVLAEIESKPMIQHVWERAKQCRELNEVLIACDHDKVLKKAKEFGAKVVMTSPDHASGSDRIAEAVKDLAFDIVVNIQGDEPFMASSIIDKLVAALKKDPSCMMATVIKQIKKQDEINDPNIVKVVIDQKGNALYFSRSVIPHNRSKVFPLQAKYFKHIGIYAYRKDFLLEYTTWKKSALEDMEQLEQLRVLESGHTIKTIETDIETIAVDTPDDLLKVNAQLLTFSTLKDRRKSI